MSKYKLMKWVEPEDKRDYSKIHLLFSNNWWVGWASNKGVTKKEIMFKSLLYALVHFYEERDVPYQQQLKDWLKENREEIIHKLDYRMRNFFKGKISEEEIKKKSKIIEKRYVCSHLGTISDIMLMMELTGLITSKTTKRIPVGYIKNYYLTAKGKEVATLIKMGYVL